ncbi:hypothetical protein AG1IA_03381 [Rhizoctonia solani AG-1 IA]|uniref:Uncharacterized protein n=1 Tax=Thanatephorus cucumeris (strain AG1-IA) TaxID=983506 RepID=L8X0K6_THACA|nr:hypothetical protein AG1IA_03381 [Rhizoctonia solani AG-1 IA]
MAGIASRVRAGVGGAQGPAAKSKEERSRSRRAGGSVLKTVLRSGYGATELERLNQKTGGVNAHGTWAHHNKSQSMQLFLRQPSTVQSTSRHKLLSQPQAQDPTPIQVPVVPPVVGKHGEIGVRTGANCQLVYTTHTQSQWLSSQALSGHTTAGQMWPLNVPLCPTLQLFTAYPICTHGVNCARGGWPATSDDHSRHRYTRLLAGRSVSEAANILQIDTLLMFRQITQTALQTCNQGPMSRTCMIGSIILKQMAYHSTPHGFTPFSHAGQFSTITIRMQVVIENTSRSVRESLDMPLPFIHTDVHSGCPSI